MIDLIQNIEQWAIERNLIEGSTPQKQMLKLMEEFGELCGGVAKNKPEVIKDSIGDCFVVIVILSNQLGVDGYVDFDADDIIQEYLDGKYSYTNVTKKLLEGIHYLGGLSLPISNGWKIQKEYIELFFMNLVLIALFNGLNFKDCMQHAYNQIKDCKGRMIDGVWVKQEDLQND
ncbi:MazG nucleotide pyrophosphohydrolase domain [Canicola haemoglobinophilus]|uniref:MazG nucleotide pyrophosphohydrolase domain n=1 Tax=Canicola haemoglobinophilus TaxID=733 RepID=A0AB38HA32_9PAST|nr:MazG-like family protein [Canicola haemoglobinophilus]STO54452.1 MazG nucleotide pyrophosphohydrolase domain [Canicola haemoglobinophilus]STO68986.1 MazG nucleotide pyrophosphohydrolase domain [Canicola haemoglobinophilus]